MFDWATSIHIPGEMNFMAWINLSTAMLDPFVPNGRNKDDDTSKKLAPSSVSNATITPPVTSKKEETE
jgi:hypothetical protein